MIADTRFTHCPKDFWANVRLISQEIGYVVRGTQQIKVPSATEIQQALALLSLGTHHLVDHKGALTEYGSLVCDYFRHRAQVLQKSVEPLLMNAEEAKALYDKLHRKLGPQTCPIPLNKQKGEKKAPAYFTAIINTLIAAAAGKSQCDYDPRVLTTITKENIPLRTLARRIDGAFPSAINPVAVWEIKEYYYTTTFGSRVADGVYESLLDGMEIEELRLSHNIHLRHYLMVDAYYTWWDCGRSYLCRLIDMLHMGYVDEILFGREVVKRVPQLVKEWLSLRNTW
jgi:hypothetical protein